MYESCVKKNSIKKQNKRQLICVTASKMYKDIAERLGLNVYIIGDTKLTKSDFSVFRPGEHISPVIRTKDGRYIKADLEWDLENIQTGRKWIKFGTKDEGQDELTELSQEEIDNIMKRIGYIKDESDYLENYIETLNLDNIDISLEQKIEKIFSDKEISKKVSNLNSSVDIYRFYRRIVKEYVTKTKEFNLFGGYSKNKKDKRKYTIMAYTNKDEMKRFWIWSNKQKKMVNVSRIIIKEFISRNLVKVVPGKDNKSYEDFLNCVNNKEEKSNLGYVSSEEIWTR